MTLTINELVEAARLHFFHLQADITNASNRIEHIRLTTLAQEAENLFINLEKFAAAEDGSGSQLPTNELLTNGAAIALPVTSGNKNSYVLTRAVAGGCCGGSNSCNCG
jgi:hypothetical protein